MRPFKRDLLPIETERLVLRIPEPKEADKMIKYRIENKDHLQKWEPLRTEKYYTLDYWKTEIKIMNNDFNEGRALRLAVYLKGDPNSPIIGVCNYTNMMRGAFQACFLGYSLDFRAQGKGVMYETLDASLRFLFDRFALHRVIANYMPVNERSGRLLRRLGFVVEGYARDYLRINGKWEDHIITSKIREPIRK